VYGKLGNMIFHLRRQKNIERTRKEIRKGKKENKWTQKKIKKEGKK
jgi:hypothetical protein